MSPTPLVFDVHSPAETNKGQNPWRDIDFLLAVVYAACHLALFSSLLGAYAPALIRMPLVLMAGITVAASALVFLKGQYTAALLSLAALLLLAVQIFQFSTFAYSPASLNTAFSYTPIAGFIVYYNARRHLNAVMEFIFWTAMAYCAIYCLFSTSIATAGADALPGAEGAKILAGDDRGARLALAIGHVVFGFFYALVRLRRSPKKLLWLLAVLLAGVSLYLSLSRSISVIVILTAVMFLFNLTGRKIRTFFLVGFLGFVAFNLAGVLVLDWNPFLIFSSDLSGEARARSYLVLQRYIGESPLFGLGLAPDRETFVSLVGGYYVFWEDLGPFGIWVTFGLVGLSASVLIGCLCLMGLRRTDLTPMNHEALLLAGFAIGLYGVQSPSAWAGTGTIISNVLVAIWVGQIANRSSKLGGDERQHYSLSTRS